MAPKSRYVGVVHYRGPLHFTKGTFLGLELVEGQGKHDGEVR